MFVGLVIKALIGNYFSSILFSVRPTNNWAPFVTKYGLFAQNIHLLCVSYFIFNLKVFIGIWLTFLIQVWEDLCVLLYKNRLTTKFTVIDGFCCT